MGAAILRITHWTDIDCHFSVAEGIVADINHTHAIPTCDTEDLILANALAIVRHLESAESAIVVRSHRTTKATTAREATLLEHRMPGVLLHKPWSNCILMQIPERVASFL